MEYIIFGWSNYFLNVSLCPEKLEDRYPELGASTKPDIFSGNAPSYTSVSTPVSLSECLKIPLTVPFNPANLPVT